MISVFGKAADAVPLVVGTMTFCLRNFALTQCSGNDKMSSKGDTKRDEDSDVLHSRKEKDFASNHILIFTLDFLRIRTGAKRLPLTSTILI
jgi:hypothetical protein